MTQGPSLLFLCGGRRVTLLKRFRDALAPHGGRVLATDTEFKAATSFVADDTFLVAPCSEEEPFCRDVAEIVEREGVTAIVPLTCASVAALLSLEGRVPSRLIGGDALAVSVSVDKVGTAQHFSNLGLATPEVVYDPRPKDLPLFRRDRRGEGSRGARAVTHSTELAAALTVGEEEPIFTRYLEGPEYTVDCYKDLEGRIRSIVPRERLRIRAGEVERSVTRSIPDLARLARAAIEPLSFVGPASVQAIRSSGSFYLTELNLRYSGGVTLSMAAGMRSETWLVAELLGLVQEEKPEIRWDLAMCRFDEDIYFEDVENAG